MAALPIADLHLVGLLPGWRFALQVLGSLRRRDPTRQAATNVRAVFARIERGPNGHTHFTGSPIRGDFIYVDRIKLEHLLASRALRTRRIAVVGAPNCL